MKLGSNVARENLISLGTCFGSVLEVKFNMTGCFQESSQNLANFVSTLLPSISLHPMRSTRYRHFCNTREDKDSNLLCCRKSSILNDLRFG